MSVSPSSRQRKAWDLNPHDPEVARFSKPARRAVSGYLPKLPQWTHRESNPDYRHAIAVSSRWTMSPVCSVDRMGVEPGHRPKVGPPTLQGSVAPDGMPARSSQRSVRELNPVSVLTTDVCNQNTYRPNIQVIPDGLEPSLSCMSRRRLRLWTTGSSYRE